MKNLLLQRKFLLIVAAGALIAFCSTAYADVYKRNAFLRDNVLDEELLKEFDQNKDACIRSDENILSESNVNLLIQKGLLKENSTVDGIFFLDDVEIVIKSNVLAFRAPNNHWNVITCGGCPSDDGCVGNVNCYWWNTGLFGWRCRGRCGFAFAGCGGCSPAYATE